MFRFSRQKQPLRRQPRSSSSRPCRFEPLEQKLPLFAATGYAWEDPHVSFSYVPDGADGEGYSSVLFEELDAIAPTEVWQREFARALQTWANAANLNFHEVSDDGSPSGSSGSVQGNPSFGDIRLASHPLDSGYLAYAYFPVSYNTLGGDIFLNSGTNFQVGGTYDLYSVLLHEAGHSLGLDHSAGSVMNSSYLGIFTGLTADDVAGIQSIYGARLPDSFDLALANDTLATATSLEVDASGGGNWQADLTSMSDSDYYLVTAPDDSDGTLAVAVNGSGLSLLAPKVSVYDANGVLLTELGQTDYGSTASVSLSNITAGANYYVAADGGTTDVFGMGAYRLDVSFGTDAADPPPPPPPPPADITSDRFEVNDTVAAATDLGRLNSRTETGLTLHESSDVDFFRFQTRKSGTFQLAATFDEAGVGHSISVYDLQQNLLATANGQLSLQLSGSYFVEVQSPSGDLGTYELNIEKAGGGSGGNGGGKGGGKGKKNGVSGDGYLASSAETLIAAFEQAPSSWVDDTDASPAADEPADPLPSIDRNIERGHDPAKRQLAAMEHARRNDTRLADAIFADYSGKHGDDDAFSSPEALAASILGAD